MAFLDKKVHIDVVEFNEGTDSYELLVDFYYNFNEGLREELQINENGEEETILKEGYEAEGWRYRLSVVKEHVTNIEQLKEALIEEYKLKAKSLGYEIKDEKIEVNIPML